MISVHNFYWVLNNLLLHPVDIDCCYYYPFGTMDTFCPLPPKTVDWDNLYVKNKLAFFYYDQEPIITPDLGIKYYAELAPWQNQLQLFANSEHSHIKKEICQTHCMLDWYFFYHGFAALDWFRDARLPLPQENPRKPFLSLAHLSTGEKSYRLHWVALLRAMEILDQGYVSLSATHHDIRREIVSCSSLLSHKAKCQVSQILDDSDVHLPMRVDVATVTSDFSARFGHQDHAVWQSAVFHVVNESNFYRPKLHLTEKIFKPIVAKRPFVLISSPGNLQYLRSYGFKTFSEWIDESYDQEPDADKRLNMIANEIKKICELPWPNLLSVMADMHSVLDHNYQHFFNEFREIIVNELVDNFDTCIRIWNNGRLQYRCAEHPDLKSVKRYLLS